MAEIIYFIITIGILVFVHEFGHFAAAKMSKMRVDAFAIGFGYRLFGYNKITGFTFGNLPKEFDTEGNTDYRLCLFPLGGYVKIVGMVDESMDTKFAEEEPKEYEFRAKPLPHKAFVITAGVLMNLLLAFFVLWGIKYYTGEEQIATTTVGYVHDGSLADSAGFATGDKILSINGKDIATWDDLHREMFINSIGKDVDVTLERSGIEEKLTVPKNLIPSIDSSAYYLIADGFRTIVGEVMEGSPADSAGLLTGDVILKIQDITLAGGEPINRYVQDNKDTTITMVLLRESDTLKVSLIPNEEGLIGIGQMKQYMGEISTKSYGIFEAAGKGINEMIYMVDLTFSMVGNVIAGDVEFGQVFGGPVKIAQFAAKTADVGFISFLRFLAMLSLSLAIINIMPFPVLDGGHLIIILIEGVMRRELPIKAKIAIQNAGFFILLALMAFIIYSDIISL